MGVTNQTPFGNVQYLRPINEDTDIEAYAIGEAEGTPGLTEKANFIPEGAYVMKDGDNPVDYLSGPTPTCSPHVSAYPSARASDAPFTSFSKMEDSDTPPQLSVSEPEDPIAKEARMSQLISTSLRIAEAVSKRNTEPVLPSKPTWWTVPWQRLEQEALPTDPRVIPRVVSLREFREQADSTVRALDFYGSRQKIDPDTGEETA
jgi:hypothetical protein